MTPSRGSRASPLITKRARMLDWFQEGHAEFAILHLPIGHHRAAHLIDCDLFWNLDSHLARRSLHDLKPHLRINRSRVFSEAGQLCQRSAQSQGSSMW